MGLANIELISTKLIQAGLDKTTPAAAIQNGTTGKQNRVLTTLEDLFVNTQGLQAPVIFVIGKVVTLAHQLDWFTEENVIEGEFVDNEKLLHG